MKTADIPSATSRLFKIGRLSLRLSASFWHPYGDERAGRGRLSAPQKGIPTAAWKSFQVVQLPILHLLTSSASKYSAVFFAINFFFKNVNHFLYSSVGARPLAVRLSLHRRDPPRPLNFKKIKCREKNKKGSCVLIFVMTLMNEIYMAKRKNEIILSGSTS